MNLFKDIISQIINWNGWDWDGWVAISAIALVITIIVIAFQAYATKKFAKFSVMPNAFFVLRSKGAELKRKGKLGELWGKISNKEKLDTQFIIRNNSKFPILFKVKIIFIHNNKQLSHDHYWRKDSLHVNPRRMTCPDVINLYDVIKELENKKDKDLENVIENKKNNDEKITANIEYKYTPRFVKEYSKKIKDTWVFHFNTFNWIGPNGIIDENIYLPGERIDKK